MSGVAVCIGAVAEAAAPTAEALSIVLPGGGAHGNGNTTQLNVLEGNVFNPQLGLLGGNASANSVLGNVAKGNGNRSGVQVLSTAWNSTISLAGTTGNGNTTQVDIFSYNVFNPQVSVGGENLSRNSTTSNVATNNGNHSSTDVTAGSGSATTLGTTGNGNVTQIAVGSGNIFNPQWSFGGSNVSHNSTTGNVATNNGNYSDTSVGSSGSGAGTTTVGTTGNGNVRQYSLLSFDVFNPQRSTLGFNSSDNSSTSNVSSNNGNHSATSVTSSGGGSGVTAVGTTGNGNANQRTQLSGSIFNRQVTSGLKLPKSSAAPGVTKSTVGADAASAPRAAVDAGAGAGGADAAGAARAKPSRPHRADPAHRASAPRHLKADN